LLLRTRSHKPPGGALALRNTLAVALRPLGTAEGESVSAIGAGGLIVNSVLACESLSVAVSVARTRWATELVSTRTLALD
jgi:hypothetical protein